MPGMRKRDGMAKGETVRDQEVIFKMGALETRIRQLEAGAQGALVAYLNLRANVKLLVKAMAMKGTIVQEDLQKAADELQKANSETVLPDPAEEPVKVQEPIKMEVV